MALGTFMKCWGRKVALSVPFMGIFEEAAVERPIRRLIVPVQTMMHRVSMAFA